MRLTKDKLAVKRKLRFCKQKAAEKLSFSLSKNLLLISDLGVTERLPEEAALKQTLRKFGKFDGVYIKSYGANNHWIYIGFTKPRYTNKFVQDFKDRKIELFDYDNTHMITLDEAEKVSKQLKKQSLLLADTERGIDVGDIETETLSPDCLMHISNIPGEPSCIC